jgi:hypothetical protein
VKITPTHRRVAFVILVAMAAFGAGGLVGSATAEPEVEFVTVSEDVPSACADAAREAADGFKAWENLDQYETRAGILAGDLTVSVVEADAAALEAALAPIAANNEKEAEQRVKRDTARAAFETAANECLARAAAAEAARDR